ncbi:MAG: transcription elongation factor GreA [Lachnospiraceae bacterium]|nr:transcription elongation factor GreA [Lachnospiraceae bacterium]
MFDNLTKSDIQKMEEEIEYRKLQLRPGLIESLKEARAQGDLSENFEYYAAKREKNKNDSRIRYLEKMIKTANVIEDNSKEDEVGMNNTVEIYFEEDDLVETYRIVTTVRSDALNQMISIESPLGKALMGKKVGDRVEVVVNPSYSYYVQIRKIENTTDDSGDKIRSY